jgi:hypothetical protein
MKNQVTRYITLFFGMFFIVSAFIVAPEYKAAEKQLNNWALIIISFAYILGVINVARIHAHKVGRRVSGWGYSVVTLFGMGVMIIFGIFVPVAWMGGYEQGSLFAWLFDNGQVPLQATMFSLLAFFIASAAFRAFRVKNVLASLLAVTAVLVMMGRVSLGEMIWPDFPRFVEWIMSNLQTAGQRAVKIGAALGAVATGLKIVLGIEQTYFSGE